MRSRGIVVALVAIGLAVGACGSGAGSAGESDKSAKEIFADVKDAIGQARSVHIKSTGNDKPIDVVLTKAGQAAGTITLGNGSVVNIVVISADVVYARTPKTKGKFGKLKPAAAEEVSSSLSMKVLLQKGLSPDGTVKKGKSTTVDGQKVIELRDEPAGDQLFVTDSDHPYPVKAVEDNGKHTTVFSDWDKKVTLKDPAKQTA